MVRARFVCALFTRFVCTAGGNQVRLREVRVTRGGAGTGPGVRRVWGVRRWICVPTALDNGVLIGCRSCLCRAHADILCVLGRC